MNEISIYGPLAETHPDFGQFVATVEQLFEHSMDPDILDDRLNRQWQTEIVGHDSYRAVLCTDDTHRPIGLLEHWTTGTGNVRLELLLDRDFTEVGAETTISIDEGVALVETLFVALRRGVEGSNTLLETKPHSVELWARPTSLPVEQIMANLKAQLTRHLFQMRTAIGPLDPDFVDQSVAFTMADRDELIEVNNQAFASHPDQGNMTKTRFDRIVSEPWFRPDGIRLWRIKGRIAAFCWTKIHNKPAIGEIYVVGVSPHEQGQGHGKLVTAGGIHWLRSQNHEQAMLYVEASNTPAVSVYNRLGFSTVRTDKAWELPLSYESYDFDPSPESLT